MPDWYVLRSDNGYQVRLGGCEYSLTEEEFQDLASAFYNVRYGYATHVESDEYKDIVICNSEQKVDLRELLKQKPFDRRF